MKSSLSTRFAIRFGLPTKLPHALAFCVDRHPVFVSFPQWRSFVVNPLANESVTRGLCLSLACAHPLFSVSLNAFLFWCIFGDMSMVGSLSLLLRGAETTTSFGGSVLDWFRLLCLSSFLFMSHASLAGDVQFCERRLQSIGQSWPSAHTVFS